MAFASIGQHASLESSAGEWGQKPRKVSGLEREVRKSAQGCPGGVASGLEGGAEWEEQVTQVCSGECLRHLCPGRGATG